MRMRTIFTSILLVIMVSVMSFSQTPVKESFSYLPTTLDGVGSSGNGFGGSWVANETGGIEGLVSIGNSRFSYVDLNWEIPHDTLHLQVIKSGAWSDHNRYKRPLAEAWPNTAGAKYWVSYLIDVKDSLPIGNTYFFVKLFDGDTERLAIGKAGGRDANSPVWTCGSGWTGSGDDVSTVDILTGPVWLVVRVDMSGNTTGVERTYMWIDPDPSAEPDTNTAIVKRNSTMPNGFDAVALEFGGDGTNVRLIFDEITLAASYADLTSSTPAGTVARESFEYSPTSLDGVGSSGNGFGGSWVANETGGIEALVAIGNSRFSYGDLNWEIPHDTLHLQVTKSGAWSDHNRYKRPLAEAWPNTAGAKYWVSYLLDVKDLPVGNTYFFVKLFDGDTERLAIGKAGGRDANSPVWTCGSGWTGSGDDVSTVDILTGPVWLVVRVDMSGSTTGVERTYMWIDPDPSAEPDTNTAIVKRNSTMPNGFDAIALEFGGDGGVVRLIFDEIRLANNYEGLTTVDVRIENNNIPVKYDLSQNFPNPFNPTTNIRFAILEAGLVNIKVYNMIGEEVADILNEYKNAGTYIVDFNAANLPSGVYFYKLSSGKYSETKKMLLLK